jgi:hypothetical protein
MDAEVFLSENPDWWPYRDVILICQGPEFFMGLWPDVNPEVLARCRELLSGGFTRGALYYRVRIEDSCRDNWATPIALQQYPRSAAAQARMRDAQEAGYLD